MAHTAHAAGEAPVWVGDACDVGPGTRQQRLQRPVCGGACNGQSISNYVIAPTFLAQNVALRCVLPPAPLVPGVPTKTHLESRICDTHV